MNRLIISITTIVGIAVGCSKPAAPLKPAKPVALPGYTRQDDPDLTADVVAAIETAKAHLEKTGGQPIDAMYKVTKTAAGFDVHVEYVTGYDDSG